MERKCLVCNSDIFHMSSKATYCSQRCQKKDYRHRKPIYYKAQERELICNYCGKLFKTKGKRKYCSADCSHKASRIIKGVIRECILCGKGFEPSYKPQKYCSHKCSQDATRLRTKHICKNCGKEFMPKVIDRTTYCSRECSFADIGNRTYKMICIQCGKEFESKCGSKNQTCKECKEKAKTKKEALKINICQYCGKEFKAKIKRKYCNKECQYKAAAESIKQRYRDKNNVVLDERPCKECGRLFIPKYSFKVCCSDKCEQDYKHMIHHKRREETQKGIVFLNTGQWSKARKYFKYKCAYCGKHSENIELEHFKPFIKGGKFTKDNIIPACKSCNSSKRDKDFFEWYPKQPFYSKAREKKILNYLGYSKSKEQQLKLIS
jgi:uncharacterized Zn-finger protein